MWPAAAQHRATAAASLTLAEGILGTGLEKQTSGTEVQNRVAGNY